MAEPFIFVTTNTINDGELESIKQLSERFTELAEAHDTGLLAFHFHLNEDGTELSNVQVHADAASMDAYLAVVADRIAEALQLSATTSIDIYGTPGPVMQEALRHNAALGVPIRVKADYLNGFTRAAVA